MVFYSIYKIIKDIFRTIFGSRALRFILIIFIILFVIFSFDKNVFAVSSYNLNTNYFSESVISQAHTTLTNKVGADIWENEDYDIFIGYRNAWWSNFVFYVNVSKMRDDYGDDIKMQFYVNNNGTTNFRYYTNGTTEISTSDYGYNNVGSYSWELGGSRTMRSISEVVMSSNSIRLLPIRTHYDIFDPIQEKVFDKNATFFVPPSFVTTDTELETFDFDYLQISGGSTKYYSYFEPLDMTTTPDFTLTYWYNGVPTTIDILPDYVHVNESTNTWSIAIPYNALTNKVIVRNGATFRYRFKYENGYESGYEIITSELTYDLTSQQQQDINEDSEKQLQGQLLEQQQATNDKLDNLDSTINDSNVDDITNDSLPHDSTNDPTQDGVNGIFTNIYNAFCTGTAQDIVFPIPFTNKNIVLSANYVSFSLTNSGATWVITLIQAFWWYLISRFIIKDIMNKINKIKSGNIEDIETTNIRGDML